MSAIMDTKRGKIAHLVVDSGAFLKNAPIYEIAAEVYTVRSVIDEIKDRATKERLQVLPDELILREPTADCIKIVSEFSRKTGDYLWLSAVDIRLLALAYELHKEHIGIENLRSEPVSNASVKPFSSAPNEITNMPGFYLPKGKKSQSITERAKNVEASQHVDKCSSSESEDGSHDDDEGWLAPENLDEALKGMGLLKVEDDDQPVAVACITTDFTMQNTLIQLGIKVISVDGMLIRRAKTFILRCYGCFKTTSKMTSRFCPHCGNKTLRRVAVTVNEDGCKELHLNFRRPINPRGSRYPLPMPKGGKHSNNPILVADQPLPQNRPSKMGNLKTDALNEDYPAGLSPFALNDVYSRAAHLGIHGRRNMARNHNPNVKRKK